MRFSTKGSAQIILVVKKETHGDGISVHFGKCESEKIKLKKFGARKKFLVIQAQLLIGEIGGLDEADADRIFALSSWMN